MSLFVRRLAATVEEINLVRRLCETQRSIDCLERYTGSGEYASVVFHTTYRFQFSEYLRLLRPNATVAASLRTNPSVWISLISLIVKINRLRWKSLGAALTYHLDCLVSVSD